MSSDASKFYKMVTQQKNCWVNHGELYNFGEKHFVEVK